jgi:hypothetical protein
LRSSYSSQIRFVRISIRSGYVVTRNINKQNTNRSDERLKQRAIQRCENKTQKEKQSNDEHHNDTETARSFIRLLADWAARSGSNARSNARTCPAIRRIRFAVRFVLLFVSSVTEREREALGAYVAMCTRRREIDVA